MEKILVIDDEQSYCFIVERIAKQIDGIAVQTCSDPAEAVGIMRGSEFSRVYIDYNLGTCVGTDLYEEILDSLPSLRENTLITIWSSFDHSSPQAQAIKAKNIPFVLKPIGASQIIELLAPQN